MYQVENLLFISAFTVLTTYGQLCGKETLYNNTYIDIEAFEIDEQNREGDGYFLAHLKLTIDNCKTRCCETENCTVISYDSTKPRHKEKKRCYLYKCIPLTDCVNELINKTGLETIFIEKPVKSSKSQNVNDNENSVASEEATYSVNSNKDLDLAVKDTNLNTETGSDVGTDSNNITDNASENTNSEQSSPSSTPAASSASNSSIATNTDIASSSSSSTSTSTTTSTTTSKTTTTTTATTTTTTTQPQLTEQNNNTQDNTINASNNNEKEESSETNSTSQQVTESSETQSQPTKKPTTAAPVSKETKTKAQQTVPKPTTVGKKETINVTKTTTSTTTTKTTPTASQTNSATVTTQSDNTTSSKVTTNSKGTQIKNLLTGYKSKNGQPSHALSAALIAALSFGILFFVSVLALVGKRCFDGWQRRHYSRIDYLVNGMYN